MNVDKKEFPTQLKRKINPKTKKPISITYYNGSNITNNMFNIKMLEPYKIVFSNQDNHVVVYVIENQQNYDFFVGSIDKGNKYTMTSLLSFVNSVL